YILCPILSPRQSTLAGATEYLAARARSTHVVRLRARRRNVGSEECPPPFSRRSTIESTDQFRSSGRVAQSLAQFSRSGSDSASASAYRKVLETPARHRLRLRSRTPKSK